MIKKDETTTKTAIKENKEEAVKFSGKFIETVGRRKSSTARTRLYKKGKGVIIVNGQKISEYFASDKVSIIKQAVKLVGHSRDLDFSVLVKGGGIRGQAEAVRHGISRALLKMDEELKPALKAKGLLSRDARVKERKKPGLKKARRAPQWSKR
jgi:small subunit ribosomal protein S9